MSQYERNTRYLELHRIIYRRDPVNDLPTETFDVEITNVDQKSGVEFFVDNSTATSSG